MRAWGDKMVKLWKERRDREMKAQKETSEELTLNVWENTSKHKSCVLHITGASFFLVLKYRQQLNALMTRYQTISFFVKWSTTQSIWIKNAMTASSTSYLILNEIIFLFTRNVYKFPDDCIGKKGMQASKFM